MQNNKRNPMFDIEKCEDVRLVENETTGQTLAKIKDTKNITAERNKVVSNEGSKKWHQRWWMKALIFPIAVGVVVGLIVGL